MLWTEVRPQTKFMIRTVRPIAEAELRVISQLYLPIIHADGYSLYLFLYHQLSPDLWRSGEFSHRYLMDALGLHLNEIITARERLEGIGLLSTFRLTEGNGLEYQLIPPLTPFEYFQSEVLSLSLLNRMGKTAYRRIREQFSLPPEIRFHDILEKEEITKDFSEVFKEIRLSEVTPGTDSETEELMNELEKSKPLPEMASHFQPSTPQVKLDFAYLEALFPIEDRPYLFTQVNKGLMMKIHFLYGIQLDDIGILLRDTYQSSKRKWDLERFEEMAKRLYRIQKQDTPLPSTEREVSKRPAVNPEEHLKNLKSISPYQLLRNYQDGGKVSLPDQNLIEYLLNDLGLEAEVVNVLLDFVLLTYDNKLPRAITEKIASNWKRKGFKTAEEAFAFAQEEYAKQVVGQRSKRMGLSKSSPQKMNKAKKQVPDFIWVQVERERKQAERKEAENPEVKQQIDVEEVQRMIEELEGRRDG